MNRANLKYLYIGLAVILAAGAAHWMSKPAGRSSPLASASKPAKAPFVGVEIVTNQPLAPNAVTSLQFGGEMAQSMDVQVPAMINGRQFTLNVKAVSARWPIKGGIQAGNNLRKRQMFKLNSKNKLFGMVASADALKAMGAKKGDIVTIGKAQFRIRGMLKKWPGHKENPQAVLIGMGGWKATEIANVSATHRYQVRLNPVKAAEWKQKFATEFPDAAKAMHDWPAAAK